MHRILLIILLVSIAPKTFAQEQLTRILFILDASNSMNAKWEGQTRIEAAKELLAKAVDSLKDVPNLELGLRVYGHQSPITATYQDCNDTKLEIPFSVGNHDRIKYRIKSIQAKGTTPIARSLEAAAEDFPDNKSRNVIILITDGLEACDNDPCVIAKKLKDKGVNVTPFVIGLGMDLSYLDKFNCIGPYFDAETKDSFKRVLGTVITKALVNTTAQINLNDIHKNPKETEVTMFLYEAGTKNLLYTFVHTINRFGNPDTLIIDPKYKYDLVVNTIPKVEKKNISLIKNTHNTIVVDAPQGFIKVRFINATSPYQIDTRIMQSGSPATLNVQKMNSTDKYIVGKYELEVLTLPRTYITVDVTQSSTTTVDVIAPGFLSYKASNYSAAQIFLKKEDGKLEWVCNLDPSVLSGSWQLQPGSYRLVYRQKNMRSSTYTIEKDFRIQSNKTTTLNF
jgi:Ca-activated chloride channel family protein